MTDTELFKQIRDNVSSLDYIVVIHDILDNHTHVEVLSYELEYDLFTWLNDWYEGQDYVIIGYVPISNIKVYYNVGYLGDRVAIWGDVLE